MRDTVVIRLLREKVGGTEALSPEGPWYLARSLTAPVQLVLLHRGVEVGRLSTESSEKILTRNPKLLEEPPEVPQIQTGRAVREYFHPEQFSRLLEWPEGLRGYWQPEVASSGVAVLREGIGLELRRSVQGEFPVPVYLGARLGHRAFVGDLQRIPEDNGAPETTLDWGLEVGVPGILLELRAAPWAVPDFVWAEADDDSLMVSRAEGKLLVAHGKSDYRDLRGNVEGLLHLRLGFLHWVSVFDAESYSQTLNQLRIEGMPVGVTGDWGTGVTFAPSGMIPGVWARAELGEWGSQTRLGEPPRIPWLTLGLRGELWYRSLDQLSAQLRMEFDFGRLGRTMGVVGIREVAHGQ